MCRRVESINVNASPLLYADFAAGYGSLRSGSQVRALPTLFKDLCIFPCASPICNTLARATAPSLAAAAVRHKRLAVRPGRASQAHTALPAAKPPHLRLSCVPHPEIPVVVRFYIVYRQVF